MACPNSHQNMNNDQDTHTLTCLVEDLLKRSDKLVGFATLGYWFKQQLLIRSSHNIPIVSASLLCLTMSKSQGSLEIFEPPRKMETICDNVTAPVQVRNKHILFRAFTCFTSFTLNPFLGHGHARIASSRPAKVSVVIFTKAGLHAKPTCPRTNASVASMSHPLVTTSQIIRDYSMIALQQAKGELSTWASRHSQRQCISYSWSYYYYGSCKVNGIVQCKNVFPTPMPRQRKDSHAHLPPTFPCICYKPTTYMDLPLHGKIHRLDVIQCINRMVWLDFCLKFDDQNLLSQRTMK